MRQPLVAGNWKMNGSLDSITALVEGIKAGLDSVTTAEMVVCPPFVYIPTVASLIGGASISLGAQDVNGWEPRMSMTRKQVPILAKSPPEC
jgi:triosephosphate isomerase